MANIRPIDANALKKSITDYHAGLFPRYISKLVDAEIEDIKDIVDEQITLDYAPVVHGEWIPLEEPQWNCFGLVTIGYRCSECGREEPYNNEPYCHCGAKMDAKEE